MYLNEVPKCFVSLLYCSMSPLLNITMSLSYSIYINSHISRVSVLKLCIICSIVPFTADSNSILKEFENFTFSWVPPLSKGEKFQLNPFTTHFRFVVIPNLQRKHEFLTNL